MTVATAPAPETGTGPDVVIGVDTHKHTHMAVALSANGGWLGSLKLDAKRSGYQELMRWAAEFGSNPMFAVEGTGCYGAGLCRSLQTAALEVVEVNRPDRSTRRRLGKDDTIDAEAAARTFIAGKATVIPKAGDDLVEMIRMLKVVKDSATDNRTAALNQLHAIVVTAPAALRERLQRLKGKELVECCSGLRSGEISTPLAAAKMALRTLARRIQQLDQELKETVAQLDRLTMQHCPELRNTYGIGVDISATLVVAVGDNQERLKSEASFAALCGVNPLPASSGKVVRHRLNRSGNRQANCALHCIVICRLQRHQQTRDYVQRRPQGHLLNKTGDAGRVQFRAPAFPKPGPAPCPPAREAGALLQLDRNRQASRIARGRRDHEPQPVPRGDVGALKAGASAAAGGAGGGDRFARGCCASSRDIGAMAQRETDARACAPSEHGINAADGQGLRCPQQDAPVIGLGTGQPDHLGRHRTRRAKQ